MGIRSVTAIGIVTAGLGLFTWSTTAAHRGSISDSFPPHTERTPTRLSGPDASTRRLEILRRAQVRLQPEALAIFQPARTSSPEAIECRFLLRTADGTSAKFDCTLMDGSVVKVKYGRNPEIHAEAAATRLLMALGYPADFVTIVPRLRCYGCPRFPFVTMKLFERIGAGQLLAPAGYERGYTDFEWASVEHRFPAPPIETDTEQGWAWFELEKSAAPRADLDALRLLAIFLGHWDNKSQNQRLVCLDSPANPSNGDCKQPLAMIHDLGSTFGPTKVNLSTWMHQPVWRNSRTCEVTMEDFPFHGSTFQAVQISEAGRRQFLAQLDSLRDEDVRRFFADGRFGAFQSNTDDRRDIDQWTAAFKGRVGQIRTAGPCP